MVSINFLELIITMLLTTKQNSISIQFNIDFTTPNAKSTKDERPRLVSIHLFSNLYILEKHRPKFDEVRKEESKKVSKEEFYLEIGKTRGTILVCGFVQAPTYKC
jgi:hypothetical protein